jgi:CrcB protein
MLKHAIYIFIGSGLGGIIRFGLGKWISSIHSTNFPLGTFIVNILACFIVGFVIGLADSKQIISASAKMFWVVAFVVDLAHFQHLVTKLSIFCKQEITQQVFYTLL